MVATAAARWMHGDQGRPRTVAIGQAERTGQASAGADERHLAALHAASLPAAGGGRRLGDGCLGCCFALAGRGGRRWRRVQPSHGAHARHAQHQRSGTPARAANTNSATSAPNASASGPARGGAGREDQERHHPVVRADPRDALPGDLLPQGCATACCRWRWRWPEHDPPPSTASGGVCASSSKRGRRQQQDAEGRRQRSFGRQRSAIAPPARPPKPKALISRPPGRGAAQVALDDQGTKHEEGGKARLPKAKAASRPTSQRRLTTSRHPLARSPRNEPCSAGGEAGMTSRSRKMALIAKLAASMAKIQPAPSVATRMPATSARPCAPCSATGSAARCRPAGAPG